MARSTPDKSGRWPLSLARPPPQSTPGILFLLRAHACVSRAHVCARGVVRGGRTSGEDYVYVGKEGGWLEPRKVEAPPRGWEEHEEDAREGKNGRLICRALVPPIRVLFIPPLRPPRSREAPFIPLRLAFLWGGLGVALRGAARRKGTRIIV